MTLNTRIFLGAVVGIALGAGFLAAGEGSALREQGLYFCNLVSMVFVDLLKMVLMPLMFTSIVVGVANLRAHAQIHKVLAVMLTYSLTTLSISIFIGLLAVNIFHPGTELQIDAVAEATRDFDATSMSMSEFFTTFLHSLFMNPFAALAKLVATESVALLGSLAKLIAVVMGTTLLHGLIILPLILIVLTRMHPLRFFRGARPALVTAFATSSSAATMPVTLDCLEQDLKVTPDVARFVVPVGSHMNMDGTALYEAAAALFVATCLASTDDRPAASWTSSLGRHPCQRADKVPAPHRRLNPWSLTG